VKTVSDAQNGTEEYLVHEIYGVYFIFIVLEDICLRTCLFEKLLKQPPETYFLFLPPFSLARWIFLNVISRDIDRRLYDSNYL
jgi:hypothetical protein